MPTCPPATDPGLACALQAAKDFLWRTARSREGSSGPRRVPRRPTDPRLITNNAYLLPFELAEASSHLELAYGLLHPSVELSDVLLGVPGETAFSQVRHAVPC
jgi:hypothetical protein